MGGDDEKKKDEAKEKEKEEKAEDGKEDGAKDEDKVIGMLKEAYIVRILESSFFEAWGSDAFFH